MATKETGGAAFPAMQKVTVPAPELGPNIGRSELHPMGGMTLRDWFAGQALAGLLANPGGPIQANDLNGWGYVNTEPGEVAARAYLQADALLAERSK